MVNTFSTSKEQTVVLFPHIAMKVLSSSFVPDLSIGATGAVFVIGLGVVPAEPYPAITDEWRPEDIHQKGRRPHDNTIAPTAKYVRAVERVVIEHLLTLQGNYFVFFFLRLR